MRSFSWHKRLLPLTMTVMALLFTEKAVGLAREATAKDPVQVAASAAASVTPAGISSRPVAGASPGTMPEAAPDTAGDGETGKPLLMPSLSAPTATVGAQAAAPGELQLLQDLRKRRQTLDDRERLLDQRTDLVQAAELKLQTKLDELTVLQGRLDHVEDGRRKRDSANWGGLVKTYEDMKPRDAAAIFDVLDLNVLLEVLDRMDERKAAAILAAMLPERARLATQMLAQKRTRADAVDQQPAQDRPVAVVADQHG